MAYRVVETEHVLIPLANGVKLAARMWIPECNVQVPAILEYLPYGKRAGTYHRDELTHPYMAARGYGCVRVDIRGNGESEGLMEDEYTATELSDAVEVIAWLAAQPWCNGAVGMMGISWGGFNSLQVAALRPPALRAIISLCSSADRYNEDVHYKGGCLMNENFAWGVTMWSYSTVPPDPVLCDNWRELWLERLSALPFLPSIWLRHNTRDAYWKHGSVCENYSAIAIPSLCIGGWCDGYKNTVPAVTEALAARGIPVSGIVGPWGHKYPHFAVPEPRIGFLQIACDWWKRYLTCSSSVEPASDDTSYRLYMLLSEAPSRNPHAHRSGHWIVSSVHDPNITLHTWQLQPGRCLNSEVAVQLPEMNVVVNSPMHCGMSGGEYCAIWLGPDLPDDQRVDDAYSACFDSVQLVESIQIVGRPVVTLRLSSSKPNAQIAVRLCDVHADGASTLITFGVLNLTHHISSEHPMPLCSDVCYDVQVSLDFIAYTVPAGHVLRIAVSTAYWPLLWPSPDRVSITIHAGDIQLPLRKSVESDHDECTFPAAEAATPAPTTQLRQTEHRRETSTDHNTGIVKLHIFDDFGEERLSHGLKLGSIGQEVWSIHPEMPLSATADIEWQQTMSRDDWSMKSVCQAVMTCDTKYYYLKARLQVFENDLLIYEKEVDDIIERGV